jgi:hypothetical protein
MTIASSYHEDIFYFYENRLQPFIGVQNSITVYLLKAFPSAVKPMDLRIEMASSDLFDAVKTLISRPTASLVRG